MTSGNVSIPTPAYRGMMQLDKLIIERDMQVRAGGIDENKVKEYAEALERGDDLPAIKVFDIGGGVFLLVDGFHRVEAARTLKRDSIKAETFVGDRRAARRMAAGSNAAHGLPMSPDDKRRAVSLLLQDEYEAFAADSTYEPMGDREIARLVGVSHPFVGKLRAAFGKIKHLPPDQALAELESPVLIKLIEMCVSTGRGWFDDTFSRPLLKLGLITKISGDFEVSTAGRAVVDEALQNDALRTAVQFFQKYRKSDRDLWEGRRLQNWIDMPGVLAAHAGRGWRAFVNYSYGEKGFFRVLIEEGLLVATDDYFHVSESGFAFIGQEFTGISDPPTVAPEPKKQAPPPDPEQEYRERARRELGYARAGIRSARHNSDLSAWSVATEFAAMLDQLEALLDRAERLPYQPETEPEQLEGSPA